MKTQADFPVCPRCQKEWSTLDEGINQWHDATSECQDCSLTLAFGVKHVYEPPIVKLDAVFLHCGPEWLIKWDHEYEPPIVELVFVFQREGHPFQSGKSLPLDNETPYTIDGRQLVEKYNKLKSFW